MVNRRKRVRKNEDESDSEASGGEEAVASTSHAHSSSKRSRQEQQDDNASGNEEDSQDNEDLDCTQPELATNKSEAEVGIIEKVTLVNFMCHTMLEVPLGSNVNFIIGRNGSGKSAIMTALVVGLGGKAATTSRGSSLKAFIKKGCSYAQISIKLRNRGLDAYCPDHYGKSITVERRLSSDGSGSYKLKSDSGRTISTKKEELNHILDQFNIQVDNPISVLNQDTSRNFLNSSDPKDKYKFFLKATQLEQISSDYQMVIEQQDIIKNMLEHKAEMIPDIRKEVQTLENKYHDIKQLRTMKEQVEELKKERVWAEVIEYEKKLGPLERDVEKQQTKLPKYEQKAEECKAQIQVLEEQSKTIQDQIEVVRQEANDVTAIQTGMAAEQKQKKADLRKKESEARKIRQSLDSAKDDRQLMTDRINEIKQTAMHDLEAEKQQREERLRTKREELHASQNQLTTTSHHRDQVNQAINRAKENSYSLRNDVSDAGRAVDACQRSLNNLRSSTRDRLSLFGHWMPDLLQRIQAAGRRARFHRTPVGPIGAHMTLKDQKWALAVESAVKGLAWSFCCHDGHDEQILKQIMRQVCPRDNIPQIIISKFCDTVHDVSRNKPRCQYSTVLDELVIDDPVVANCLIDQAGIESVLLIENPSEAREVMFSSRPPQGATMAYAMNGDQLIGGRSAKYYSSFSNNAKYLQQDIEQEISRLERDLESKRQHHQRLQEQLRDLDRNINENKKEQQRANEKAMREQEVVNRLVEEITELESYEEEELPDVTTLEEEVVHYTQQIEELTQQKTVVEEEYEKAKEAHQKQELKIQRHREKVQTLLEKHEPLKAEQQQIMIKILTAKNDKKHYEDSLKSAQDIIKKAEKNVFDMKKQIEDTSEMAAQYCDRIDTQKSVKALESEIFQKERCIRNEEKNHGKHEIITKQYFEAKKKYDDIKDSMKNLKRFHKRLGAMMSERVQAFSDYRSFIALRATYFFQMMLSQRGYNGRMKFEHDKESLVLQVNVEQGSNKKAAKDTRSLSGGERSFSTVSFIMALWEAMESPFRCLDEFDVFMDMVNRRISMQMMLKVAKEQLQRQFILLTPQDMSAIGGGPNVRIFRMQDPERGQTTLSYQPDEDDS